MSVTGNPQGGRLLLTPWRTTLWVEARYLASTCILRKTKRDQLTSRSVLPATSDPHVCDGSGDDGHLNPDPTPLRHRRSAHAPDRQTPACAAAQASRPRTLLVPAIRRGLPQ
eukprot:2333364-Rhodomonas_salina.1